MKTKSKFSQIVLALAVCVGAVFFAACGADESKAPQIEWRSGGNSLRLSFISQDDTTIINKVVVKGSNGVCDMGESFGADNGSLLYGEKIAYGKARNAVMDTSECSPKNGKYEVEVATNLGTFEYELKVVK